MRIPLCSICAVLALTIGCVTDDALYLPGEPAGFDGAGGNAIDCRVAPDAPATADPTAAPAAPSSIIASRRSADPRDSHSAIGFNILCESWINE